MTRKYLPTLSELIDRLSIAQLKEVFIAEHKEEYAKEISDICHDIQLILDNSAEIDADTIRAIVVLSQMNLHRSRLPRARLQTFLRRLWLRLGS